MLIKENDDRLQELAKELGNSDEYRIIRKYQKPEYYNSSNSSSTDIKKFIGAFLDIEATGLSNSTLSHLKFRDKFKKICNYKES